MGPDLASDGSLLFFAILTAAGLIAGFWFLVVGGMARLGGWHRLAAQYRLPAHVPPSAGKTFSMQSLRFSMFATYNFIIYVTVSVHGIILKPLALYRFMHPPLFIPWERIKSIRYGSMALRSADLELPGKTITITGKSADEIQRVNPFAGRVT